MRTHADVLRDINIERMTDALESIAESLEKLANPVQVVEADVVEEGT